MVCYCNVIVNSARDQTRNPSDSISPKLELQSLVFGSGSRYSPRRPWVGLSDLVSRLGERHSPKQGREETWIVLSVKPRPGKEFCGFERTRVSLRRDGLASARCHDQV